MLRDVGVEGEETLRETATLTGLPLHLVRTAAAYYDAYRAEVDHWIEEVDAEGAQVESSSR